MFLDLQFYGLSATTGFGIFAVLCVGVYFLAFSGKYQFSSKSPKLASAGYPILGAVRFFTARLDFFRHAQAQAPTGNFTFFLGKHPIVGLSGDKGRSVFFESRELGFAEGYFLSLKP